MSSSGNFCTWNALTGIKNDGSSGITFANGNTSASMTHNGISCLGTHGIKSGKWYYEINYHADGNYSDGRLHAGWTSDLKGIKYAFFQQAGGSPDREGFGVHLWWYRNNYQGGKISYQSSTDYTGNTGASNTNLKATQTNDIIMCAIDADNHKMYWGINGNWGSTNTNGATATNSDITQVDGWSIESTWQGSTWMPAIWFAGASSGTTAIINAGQDSSFSGTKTSGSANASDSNSVGDFFYTPPASFLALSSANLPISDDIDPAQTDDDIPTKQFDVTTWTGNGSSRTITTNMQPDLVWIKSRSNANSNELYDSSRGATKRLRSDTTNSEDTRSSELTGFSSNGFTLGSSTYGGTNYNNYTYVGWSWRANGGTTASNSNGQTTSTVQANQAAGFSIVEYAGTLTGSGTKTIGHGLSKAPECIMIKNPNKTGRWFVQHTGLTSWNYYISLNTNSAQTNASGNGSMSDPTNTVFYTNWTEGSNENPYNHIAYVWHSVEGYSKFGKFEGNSNDDGPFIYTGFRPRMLWIKEIDTADDWVVYDTARSTFNPVQKVLRYENATSEFDGTSRAIDMLSNGFKIRTSNNTINQSNTFVYGCFGDVPFKYNNTF